MDAINICYADALGLIREEGVLELKSGTPRSFSPVRRAAGQSTSFKPILKLTLQHNDEEKNYTPTIVCG